MNPIAFVQKHPVATGAVVIGAIVLLMFAATSGGGQEVASSGGTAAQSDVQGGMQLQALQMQTQAQLAAASYQKDVALGEQATAKAIAEITAQVTGQGIEATKVTSLAQIGAQKEVAITGTTLEARAREAEINANLERDRLQFGTIQSQQASLVEMARINKPQPGLFSWLFG